MWIFVFWEELEQNISKNISKILSSTDSQKHPDHAKQLTRNAIKADSKKAIQETAEAAIDLTGNKIASNILKVSRNPPQNNSRTVESETEILKERYISPEKNHFSC